MSKGAAGAPREEDKVPGKRGVAASANRRAIFGLGTVVIAAFCRHGDGPPRKFAGWKKCGGQAGGAQERRAAPAAAKTHRPPLVASASVKPFVCVSLRLTCRRGAGYRPLQCRGTGGGFGEAAWTRFPAGFV